jgi:hypothetical protein
MQVVIQKCVMSCFVHLVCSMVETLTNNMCVCLCVRVYTYVYVHRQNYMVLCNRILLMIEMRSLSDGSTQQWAID